MVVVDDVCCTVRRRNVQWSWLLERVRKLFFRSCFAVALDRDLVGKYSVEDESDGEELRLPRVHSPPLNEKNN